MCPAAKNILTISCFAAFSPLGFSLGVEVVAVGVVAIAVLVVVVEVDLPVDLGVSVGVLPLPAHSPCLAEGLTIPISTGMVFRGSEPANVLPLDGGLIGMISGGSEPATLVLTYERKI